MFSFSNTEPLSRSIMLANVLKSQQAIQMSLRIIEIFIQLREAILTNREILLKLEQLENRSSKHDKEIQLIAGRYA